MLTEYISAEQCAHCRLCCHFRRNSAWETPVLEPERARQLTERSIPLMQRREHPAANEHTTFALHYDGTDPAETAPCPLLTSTGCALPREQRPFECRIWPLRLMLSPTGLPSVALYNAGCSALMVPSGRSRLISFATGPFLPTLRRFAASFPPSIRPFHSDYIILCPLN